MLDQFRKNFEYDHWATEKYVKALSEMEQPPEKAVKLLSHLVFALDVWLTRLLKEDTSGFTDPNPSYNLTDCRQRLNELHERWGKYLELLKPEGLAERIVSVNTQGKRTEHIVQNVLVHVVNHSHYHRGQLATLVHQAGGKRPNTDYIGYAFEIGESKFI